MDFKAFVILIEKFISEIPADSIYIFPGFAVPGFAVPGFAVPGFAVPLLE
jgi:hypothetical protein